MPAPGLARKADGRSELSVHLGELCAGVEQGRQRVKKSKVGELQVAGPQEPGVSRPGMVQIIGQWLKPMTGKEPEACWARATSGP